MPTRNWPSELGVLGAGVFCGGAVGSGAGVNSVVLVPGSVLFRLATVLGDGVGLLSSAGGASGVGAGGV